MVTNTQSEDRVFRALADATRRRIVQELARRPRPVHEITEQFQVTRPAISRHLRILRQAQLVAAKEVGRENVYYLRTTALREVEDWLNALWAMRLVKLKALVEGELNE